MSSLSTSKEEKLTIEDIISKVRSYIDLGSQILGIILMLTGAVQLVKYFINLF